MAHWWLCGGYVFPVVVKPEILTLEVKVNHLAQCGKLIFWSTRPKTDVPYINGLVQERRNSSALAQATKFGFVSDCSLSQNKSNLDFRRFAPLVQIWWS